jgi:hypothetical protein
MFRLEPAYPLELLQNAGMEVLIEIAVFEGIMGGFL